MVYIVGAGVGKWNNISVKGLGLVKSCDVLIYDRLIDDELLRFTREDCVKIYAGKSADNHSMKQEEINSLIVEQAKKHDIVVRLKGGDPFVFGRGGEESEVCIKNNIPFELVPGISSAIAVPEFCGIPVTHRGVSQDLHIITGHTAEDNTINYTALAKMQGTLVFLMGVKNFDRISNELISNGMDKNIPVAFLQNSGKSVFKTVLKDACSAIAINKIEPPTIIVVGKVAEFCYSYIKKSVGIIGTEDFKERLSRRLYNYDVIDIGTLEIEKYDFNINLDYEYIVLTSRNGVNIFMEYIRENKIDFRKLSHIKFAVIGKGTYNALAQYGIYADIMPDKYTALELSKELSKYKGSKLILRAEKGSEELYKFIDNYTDIKIYDTVAVHMIQADTDYIIFGSSSAVDNYCTEFKIKSKIIAIGDITASRLREYGYKPYVADEYSIEGIIKKLEVLENEENS